MRALRAVDIPPGAITIQPPDGRTLINFKTVVHTEAAPYEVDVRILQQDVHLWIRPVTFTWDFGDGTFVTREDPGIAWERGAEVDEAYTFHEYRTKGDYAVGLTIGWTADFAVGDSDPQPVDGTVEITSEPVALTALEARPQLVG